jgi:hypothetical protein
MKDDGDERRARLRGAAQAEFGGSKARRVENEEVALRRETHAATMAKVARLRELRLAHEAAQNARADAEKTAAKPPSKRRRTADR